MNKRNRKSTPKLSQFKLRVYIGGEALESDRAVARLRKICDEAAPNDYEIEVVDLSKNPQLASRYQIVATPTVIRTLPSPVRKTIGHMSKREKVLLGLDLVPPAK
jgi:circadian clock protein KaiB